MSALPFKKRRSAPSVAKKPESKGDNNDDDDSLNLFRMRKEEVFFREIERKAAERSAKQEKASVPEKQPRDKHRRDSKRRHTSISSDDGVESNLSSRKASRVDTESPARSSAKSRSAPLSSRSSRPKRGLPPPPAQVISLDSDDDTSNQTPTKSKGKGTALASSSRDNLPTPTPARHESDDDDLLEENEQEILAPDDIGASYIREAEERARKRREEQEALESEGAASAEVLIDSPLEGIPPLKFKIEVNKKLTLLINSWKAMTQRKLEAMNSPISTSVVDTMFLTWKSAKILDFFDLDRMGIKPDRQGNLYSTSEHTRDGFRGWDKVHFEAWTPELYDQHQVLREKERRRNLGEIDDEPDMEFTQPPPPAEKKIRVILKSKDYKEVKITIHAQNPISKVAKAFRNNLQLPENKIVEIHFDGEHLDDATLVEELELDDMDMLEVHVKDP